MIHTFHPEDITISTVRVHPAISWDVFEGRQYYHRYAPINGHYGSLLQCYDIDGRQNRSEDLYELNVDRNAAAHTISNPTLVYPFITYQGDGVGVFGNTVDDVYALSPGESAIGRYPMMADLGIYLIPTTDTQRLRMQSLRQHIENAKLRNVLFTWNTVATGDQKIVTIPSIFHGSGLKPGAVKLDFYAGPGRDLIGTLQDTLEDGILRETYSDTGAHDGEPAGLVLYREGIIILFATWSLSVNPVYASQYRREDTDGSILPPRWVFWGCDYAVSVIPEAGAHCTLAGRGTQEIQQVTMCAKCDGLNFSNNPTFLTQKRIAHFNSKSFYEDTNATEVRNTMYVPFETDDRFRAQVFVTGIAIFDEQRRVIGHVRLAQPVKVFKGKSYLFKITLDI